MEARDLPGHLRPVPDSGDSTAPALEPTDLQVEEIGTPQEEPVREVEDAGRPVEETHSTAEEPAAAAPPAPETAGEGPEPTPLVPGTTPGLTAPRSRARSSGFVTDVLVELGFASEERAQQAIEEARTAGRPPEQLLLEQGAITAEQLSKAVAERYGLDHVDLSAVPGRHGRGEPDLGQLGAQIRRAAGRLRRQDHPPGGDRRPDQPARPRRHQDGDRVRQQRRGQLEEDIEA